jgi:hypothetical protein
MAVILLFNFRRLSSGRETIRLALAHSVVQAPRQVRAISECRPVRLRRVFATLVVAFGIASTAVVHSSEEVGDPIPEDELADFFGDVPRDEITWGVVHSIDFVVYRGTANPPLHGSVGFYIGGHPQDVTPGRTTVRSRLGRYRANWHRTTGADGAIHQEAIVSLGGALNAKAHVWADAPNVQELEKLLSHLAKLPMFSAGVLPRRFQEIERFAREEQRVRRAVWLGWWTATLAVAWFADRKCRRRRSSGVVRLAVFAGVMALSSAAIIGVAILGQSVTTDYFYIANGHLLVTAGALISVCSLLAAAVLFVIRYFRVRSA